ncbi:MAG: glycosyltransferase family 4 protein [Gaiellaceae bacterium]
MLFLSRDGLEAYDAGFGTRAVAWDADLLSGYASRFTDLSGVVREIVRGDAHAVWVHGFTEPGPALAIAAARLARKPVLLRDEQTILRRRRPPKSWLRAAVLRALFTQVDGLAISASNGDYFRRYGIPDTRIHDVPYCVDNDDLRVRARELSPQRDQIRRRFGLADEQPVVLFVGKLSPVKQPLQLLEAFRRVRSQRKCSLLFVGEGDLEDDLRAAVGAQHIPDVRFAGFLNRSDIASAYAAADVLAFPSLHETFGLVVAEAMNFALPIVTSTTVGCAADLVHDGENGFVVLPSDVEALARALNALVGDEILRRRFGARSLELVKHRTYAAASAGIVAACERVLGKVA